MVKQSTVDASNWAINPYIKADVPALETKTLGWELLSQEGYQSNPWPYIGAGITIDPTYTKQLVASIELIGDFIKRKEGTISGKVAFPIREGTAYFLGAGLGVYPRVEDQKPFRTEETEPADESDKTGWGTLSSDNIGLSFFVKVGRMQHLHNGLYLNLPQIQFTYPLGKGVPKLSLAFGMQWHPW